MKQGEKLIRDSPESVQTAVTLGPGDTVLADALAGLQVALGVLARLAAAALLSLLTRAQQMFPNLVQTIRV